MERTELSLLTGQLGVATVPLGYVIYEPARKWTMSISQPIRSFHFCMSGRVIRMPAKVLRDEFMRGGRFQSLLLRHTQSLITQISQNAVCNRLHSIDQQFSRWLLQSYDCLASNKLIMTQELIAHMLGVRREGISHAAKRLQNLGLISYIRGGITILDRQGLEERACECYQVVRGEHQRLVG